MLRDSVIQVFEKTAKQRGVRTEQVVGDAITVFSYILEVKNENPNIKVLLDRGDSWPAELTLDGVPL